MNATGLTVNFDDGTQCRINPNNAMVMPKEAPHARNQMPQLRENIHSR